MDEVYQVVLKVLAAFFVTGILSFLLTPPVKRLAHRIGAIDVPKDARRMHKKPIPRLGGLAIYISFVIVSLVLGQWNMQNFTILIGSAIIVVLGIFDDRNALSAKFKFGIQLIAAAIPVVFGNLRIELITNPNLFSGELYVKFGALAIPITIIWIVAITNAVNLIDGLGWPGGWRLCDCLHDHAGGIAADRRGADCDFARRAGGCLCGIYAV